jgi:hypothetical protein
MSPGVPIKSLPLSCRLLYPTPYDARLVDDDGRRDAPRCDVPHASHKNSPNVRKSSVISAAFGAGEVSENAGRPDGL